MLALPGQQPLPVHLGDGSLSDRGMVPRHFDLDTNLERAQPLGCINLYFLNSMPELK